MSKTIRNSNLFIMAVLFGLAPISAQAQGDASRGEELYVECAACHTFDNDAEELGPGLQGIFGREAGALENYYYSPVLSDSRIIWNADTLNAFIADPQAAIPLNRMPYSGMPDPQDRANLIQYLMSASQ